MWFLKSSKGENYYLPPGKYTIGRKNCDLVLDDDQSISRAHAIIEVSHPPINWGNPDQPPVVKLCDCGSKYGTTLISGDNTVKAEKDAKQNLKDGDVIHFGLQWNKWRLSYEPLVVVVSALSKVEKQQLRTVIGDLGGHVVTDWLPGATHLTMTSVTLTIKAISALAHAKPIVTPQFWLSYKSAIKSRTDLPKFEDHVPPVGETVLNKYEVSFLVNCKRKTLFQGKTFYFFLEQQFRDHSCLVEAAGGVPKLMKDTKQKRLLLKEDSIPMQLLSMNSQSLSFSQVPEFFSEISDFLKSHGRRLIPASEVGLAVLHCSIEKYCNPDFNFSSMLLRTSQHSQLSISDRILATETQDNFGPSQRELGEHKVIPDSGTESRVGVDMTLDGNLNALRGESTQELLKESQQVTQLSTKDSQLPTPGPSTCTVAQSKKRLRVLEESDDEVEILSPRKVPVSNTKKPTRRVNISTASHHCDDDDPDQLFADFKESHPKTNMSSILQRPTSPDMDDEDLFADFQDDNKSSVAAEWTKKPTELRLKSQPHEKPNDATSACKRKLSIVDEPPEKPPEKRFAQLDLSKMPDDNNENEEEDDKDIQFMSASQVKKEDKSFTGDLSCNVTVEFRPLLISKKNNDVVTPDMSLDCSGVTNYKKFKKVNRLNSSGLPHIIGGRDLRPYNSFAGNNPIPNVMENGSSSEDDDGPNSLWEQVTRGRTNW